jgi:hypothetical protein
MGTIGCMKCHVDGHIDAYIYEHNMFQDSETVV